MLKRHSWIPYIALVAVGCSAPVATNPQPTPQASASTAPAVEASAPPALPTTFVLTGEVRDEDNLPVAATVAAQVGSGTPVTTTAGADGKYTLKLATGAYTITATKAGWTSRRQEANVQRDTTLNFGGVTDKGADPYFLSSFPEIEAVQVTESAAGGAMTVAIRLSEALPKASQEKFNNRLELAAGYTTPFLAVSGAPDELLKVTAAWDEAGQTVTLRYPGPYLATGIEPVVYTVRLRQDTVGKKDPITLEQVWDEMGIVDAENKAIGINRAEYAFVKPQLFPLTYEQLANKDLGYTPAIRRWNFTHQSGFTFGAARDEGLPGLVSAKVTTETRIGDGTKDVLELHFTEPMWAVKNRDFLQFNRLDKDKELVTLNVSTSVDGSAPQPFGANFKVEAVRLSRLDPKVVYLHYAPGAFKDKRWVEVTLGRDLMDPAGNTADPLKTTVAGPVS